MKHSEICIKCGKCRFDLGPAAMRASFDKSKLDSYRFVHMGPCYMQGFHPCCDVTVDSHFLPDSMNEQLRLFDSSDDVEELFRGKWTGECPYSSEHSEVGK